MNKEYPASDYNEIEHRAYFNFERPLDEIIKDFQDILKEHPTAFLQKVSGYYESDSDSYSICYYQEKTDEEKQKYRRDRESQEKRNEDWQRRQYEELKKKFEKKS